MQGKLAQHPGAYMYSRVGWGSSASAHRWRGRNGDETSVSLTVATPQLCICEDDWLPQLERAIRMSTVGVARQSLVPVAEEMPF